MRITDEILDEAAGQLRADLETMLNHLPFDNSSHMEIRDLNGWNRRRTLREQEKASPIREESPESWDGPRGSGLSQGSEPVGYWLRMRR